MGRWRTHVETWLLAEQDGRDEAAEAAFDRAFAAFPSVAPSPAFVARTVEAAWAARVRRRRLTVLATAAAAGLVLATSAVVLYAALDGGTTWFILTTAASLTSAAVIGVLSAGVTAAGWWAAGADAALTIVSAIGRPYSLAALTAIEVVAAIAFVMLHRLLRSDIEVRTPRAYCF